MQDEQTADHTTNPQVVIVGLNRSGTKLASHRIARGAGMTRIHLEPFTWADGFDVLDDKDWESGRANRRRSQEGASEHARLPVWCDGDEKSSWLRKVCNNSELIKFVELGRCSLLRRLCPGAALVGIVRSPVEWLRSLAGTDVQRNYVASQWQRLHLQQQIQDPLPEADQWLEPSLANAARLYTSLYGHLIPENAPIFDVVLSMEDIVSGRRLPLPLHDKEEQTITPQLGLSSSIGLSKESEDFIEAKLMPAFERFLSMPTPTSERMLESDGSAQQIPCSFVVIRFSDDYSHNFAISTCAKNPANQVIVIENSSNLHFPRLGEALNHGIDLAHHEIVVAVHEDVWLHDRWQLEISRAISELKSIDPDWAVLGCAGINEQNQSVGNWKDPHGGNNTFGPGESFARVTSLDEHLLIMRRSNELRFDPDLPGIHGLGTDLILQARKQGQHAYVINAPSWHKRLDEQGFPVKKPQDSSKIRNRQTLTYLADKECCDDYIRKKWQVDLPFRSTSTNYAAFRYPSQELMDVPEDIRRAINSPIILLAKGGGGSRLLGLLAQGCGVCLGADVNASSDSMDMVNALYKAVIQRYKCRAEWQQELSWSQLRLAAAHMLMQLAPEQRKCWGFKLPESLLVLPELARAFPLARFAVMSRDPLATCLRRTHMTARLDNEIGRLTLPAAYDWVGLDRDQILRDPSVVHMAYTVAHQWNLYHTFAENRQDSITFYQCRFEEILTNPSDEINRMSEWIGEGGLIPAESIKLKGCIDLDRAKKTLDNIKPSTLQSVKAIINTCSNQLGYL